MKTLTSSADRRQLFIALASMSIAGQSGAYLYFPALPTIAAEFSATERAVQGTVVAFIVGSLIGFACYGPLSDRVGRSKMLIISTFVFVGGAVVCGFANNLELLTVARFFQGVGSITGVVTGRAVIRDAWPADQVARTISHFTAVNTIAPAASPVAGALALTIAEWRTGFWMVAIIAIAALIGTLRLLPTGPSTLSLGIRAGLAHVVGSPIWRGGLLLQITTNISLIILMAGGPFVFIEFLGLTPLSYSLHIATILCGFIVVTMSSNRILTLIGTRATLLVSSVPLLLGSGLLAGVAVVAPSAWALTLALALTVGAMGLIVPTVHTLMLAPFPDLAGTATSVAMLISSAIGAGAVWLYATTLAGSVMAFGLVIAITSGLNVLWILRLPNLEAQE